MGKAVLHYSHCTSDTAHRLGARGSQALGARHRRAGRVGGPAGRRAGRAARALGERPGCAVGL